LDPKLAGAPAGGEFASPGFDDRAWKPVDIPHDWGIEGEFHQAYPGETGKLPWWGVGWYRKQFLAPQSLSGKCVYLDFDGAMSYAAVWLNGHFVGGRPYGYESFSVDLTPYLKPGESNLVAVRLDNPEESSRWYPGGGIYRNVWLVETAPVHIGQWGVQVTTPEVSREQATIRVGVSVDNRSATSKELTVSTRFDSLDASGRRTYVGSSTESYGAALANSSSRYALQAAIVRPNLWSPDSPNLYVATTTVRDGDTVLDSVETRFGIRSLKFDPKKGLLVNGRHVFAKGVCMHHDLGALGAAFNVSAERRRWAATPFGPAITRRRRNFWICATAWDFW
jgi:beta-galactosidase